MDFLTKKQSIMLNANCQLIQCTHITDLLSNLKGLLESMITKVFIVVQNVSYSQMCQNHTHSSAVPWYTTSTCVTIIILLSTLKELC